MGPGNRPIFKLPLGDFEHGYLRRYRVLGGSMDRLARLIALVLCYAIGTASAESTVYNGQTLYRVAAQSFYVFGQAASTASGACAAAGPVQAVGCQSTSLITSASGPGSCKATCTSGYTSTQAINFTCDSAHIKITGRSDWGCWSTTDPTPPNNCPVSGTVVQPSGTVFQAGDGLTNTLCLSGCQATAFMAAKHDGKNWVWGPIISTGSQCQPSSAPGTTEAVPKCSLGQCPGTFNGNQICVPCDETKQESKSSSAEAAASAASGAASGAAQNTTKNGSSSTTCKGESCTTTENQTVNNPDGSTETKTKTVTQSKADYCKENPKAGACTGSESAWGGTCQSFTCDGDAVQCAQARGAWELACQLKTEATDPTVQAGTDAIARTGEAAIKDQLGMNTSQVFDLASRLDSTSLFGTPGACPSDTTLSLGIGSVTLPFASMCPQLNLVGVAMMGLAYLIAAFIVFRPGKGA